MKVPSIYSFKIQNKTKQTRRSSRKRRLSLDANANKLRRSPRKKLEDAKESYYGNVAFEIDQQKIMVPHAITA